MNIIRQARDGWTLYRNERGELIIGTVHGGEVVDIFESVKDTPENAERLNTLWESNNFSREIKNRRRNNG